MLRDFNTLLKDFRKTWARPAGLGRGLGRVCAILGLACLIFGYALAEDEDALLSSLIQEEEQGTGDKSPTLANDEDDEEINVQELLDEPPTDRQTASITADPPSPAEQLKKFLPFKIFQSTNNAFVRTLEKNGKVSRSYTPPICAGLSGQWEVEDGMLRIKEKLHCLKDPDQPGKFGRAWYQKVEFKLDYVKGKPTLNGVFLSDDDVFRVN